MWLVGATAWAQLELPTPLEHYDSYDPEEAGRALLLQIMAELPEETRARAMALFQSARATLSLPKLVHMILQPACPEKCPRLGHTEMLLR